MDSILITIISLLGLATIVGAFKGIDWLISLKYKTKDECEECRARLKEEYQTNRDVLIRLETKVDLMLKHSKIILDE